jgi:hypothetical protein
MHNDDPSTPLPAPTEVPSDEAADPEDAPLNRAARRGKRAEGASTGAHGRNGANHARGAQGRRINPVRRTG